MKEAAWQLLCELARARGVDSRGVAPIAFRLAEELTGKPWADCFTQEWELVIRKLGVPA